MKVKFVSLLLILFLCSLSGVVWYVNFVYSIKILNLLIQNFGGNNVCYV